MICEVTVVYTQLMVDVVTCKYGPQVVGGTCIIMKRLGIHVFVGKFELNP